MAVHSAAASLSASALEKSAAHIQWKRWLKMTAFRNSIS